MPGPKIVAIDDEMEFTKAIDQFFSARGYEVHVALTGTSGVELVDYHTPDVVLVDLKLPGMDGDEVLKHIQRTHPSTKVIVITAYNDGGKTRDRLLSLGAFAHFDKPLSSLRDLAEAVKRALISPQ
jgi:two-component system response regulator (stage 0 sporulation protein F)